MVGGGLVDVVSYPVALWAGAVLIPGASLNALRVPAGLAIRPVVDASIEEPEVAGEPNPVKGASE
jgi:hypothetical protein